MEKRILYLIAVLLSATFAGCEKNSPDDAQEWAQEEKDRVERAVIVYAVNRSSLVYDFDDDASEMLVAMSRIDPDRNQLLVYKTDSATESGLYRVVRDKSGNCRFEMVCSYQRDVTSTHPDRIGEVLADALSLFPNAAYDLIFWGHGTSWRPYFSDHAVVDSPALYGYGGEYSQTGGTQTDWTDLDELAGAVPDGRFETVWFDCCYMTGIEVIYQFRDKCSTFVGYPSEVWDKGLPYDEVLPYLFSDDHDMTEAARAFYRFYADRSQPVTVAVVDMAGIEDVADAASGIIASGPLRPQTSDLLNYSRTKSSPFYDFHQFFRMTAELNGASELADVLGVAMGRTVLYNAASENDFNGRPWDSSSSSGVSTHFYVGSDSRDESYYRTLDWFKRVY
ncbi:MAG: hypothetical protein K2L59_09315 [Muribaculaceae bacterium]|nr:hypothetical protein [Muribaculaceae bacterium]